MVEPQAVAPAGLKVLSGLCRSEWSFRFSSPLPPHLALCG